jgi:hypothetical protein
VIFRPLEIISGCSGANDQSGFLYDLNAFAEREAGTFLDTMFYFWQALCGDGQEMPHLRDFEPRKLFGDKIPDHLLAIVTEVANPDNFIMIAHPKYTFGLFGGGAIRGETDQGFPESNSCAGLDVRILMMPSITSVVLI